MTSIEQFKKRLTGTKLFKWEPNTDLYVALGTLLIMWACYYGYMNIYKNNIAATALIFILFANIILAVIFPVWWIVIRKKGSFSELGITKNLIWVSLGISIILIAARVIDWIYLIFRLNWLPPQIMNALIFWEPFSIFGGVNLTNLIAGANWVPHLIMSALIFWEPFFIFGWLQSRYEKSFGIVPAIILAAGSFALYQIGSTSPEQLMGLFLFYILLGSAFGITKNIFTLWPIYWCIGSSVNSLSVGIKVGWDAVGAYAFAILIQIGFLVYVYKKNLKK